MNDSGREKYPSGVKLDGSVSGGPYNIHGNFKPSMRTHPMRDSGGEGFPEIARV